MRDTEDTGDLDVKYPNGKRTGLLLSLIMTFLRVTVTSGETEQHFVLVSNLQIKMKYTQILNFSFVSCHDPNVSVSLRKTSDSFQDN